MSGKLDKILFPEQLNEKPLTYSWSKELKLQEIEEGEKVKFDSDDDDNDYFEYDDKVIIIIFVISQILLSRLLRLLAISTLLTKKMSVVSYLALLT